MQHPVETAVTAGDMDKSPHVSKWLSTSETNSTNPKRPKLSDGIIGEHSLALSPSGIFQTVTTQQSTPDSVHTSLSHVQNGEPCPTHFPKDNVHCKPLSPLGENGLTKIDFPSVASQNKIVDPTEGNLIVLLCNFYYGQHIGDGQPEPQTHTAFKCLSCLKVLKNVKFMNYVKHHLELERQRGDSWKYHTTCQHCHRQFPTPSSCSVTLKVSMLPRSPPQSVKPVNCPLRQIRFSYSTWKIIISLATCPMHARFAVTDHHSLQMWMHISEHTMVTLRIYFAPFVSKFLKLQPYICHYRPHWERFSSVFQMSATVFNF